jgi:membrane associated rhomboid family serine protease
MPTFRFSDLAPRNIRRTWRQGGPVITAVIIALCVLVWLVEILSNWLAPAFSQIFLLNGSFNPLNFRYLPWTALTSVFFHSLDPLHLLGNMLCLVLVGPVIERLYGHLVYLWIYLLSGLGGSLGLSIYSAVMRASGDVQAASVSAFGASGAIFGLFGALLVVYRVSGVDKGQITSLLILLGLNFALPIVDNSIAWQAHVGGFLVGLLYAFVLSRVTPRMPARMGFAAKGSVWAAVFALLVIGALVALA